MQQEKKNIEKCRCGGELYPIGKEFDLWGLVGDIKECRQCGELWVVWRKEDATKKKP